MIVVSLLQLRNGHESDYQVQAQAAWAMIEPLENLGV